jgi:hypothetical protein
MLLTRFGHVSSGLVWELVKLGSQSGAGLGIVVGPPIVFGFLRRVPIRRIATDTLVGLLYGGICGYALSLPFAQPRPVVPLIVVGACAGFAAAALRLWALHRDKPVPAAAPLSGLTRELQ